MALKLLSGAVASMPRSVRRVLYVCTASLGVTTARPFALPNTDPLVVTYVCYQHSIDLFYDGAFHCTSKPI